MTPDSGEVGIKPMLIWNSFQNHRISRTHCTRSCHPLPDRRWRTSSPGGGCRTL